MLIAIRAFLTSAVLYLAWTSQFWLKVVVVALILRAEIHDMLALIRENQAR